MTRKGEEVSDGGLEGYMTHFTRVSNVPRATPDQFAVPLAEEGSAMEMALQVSITSATPVRYQMCLPALSITAGFKLLGAQGGWGLPHHPT